MQKWEGFSELGFEPGLEVQRRGSDLVMLSETTQSPKNILELYWEVKKHLPSLDLGEKIQGSI